MKILFWGLAIFFSCSNKSTDPTTVQQLQNESSMQEFFHNNPTWKGSTQLSKDSFLEFSVTFAVMNDDVKGTISIPMQNAYDIPLEDIRLENGTLYFTLKPSGMPKLMWAKYSFENAHSAGELDGYLKQAGKTFPSRLMPGEILTLNRPQTPKPPFPYSEREVVYNNPNDGATLAGTLTIPYGDGPHPAVLLITGSGTQDRDETIFDHKPFWVIADHLTRSGIAVLRVDDRGIGGSSGVRDDVTTLIFAEDVAAGLDFLNNQSEIDHQNIGLIGHSEGGLIAPIVASQREDVAFVVMLAGTGVNGYEVLLRQNENIYRAAGFSETQIQELLRLYADIMDPSIQSDDEYERAKRLTTYQLELNQAELSAEEMEVAIQQLITVKNLPWMHTFLTLEPSDYLSKVTVPVLALNGTLDLQVAYDQNLPAIEEALQNAGNTNYKAMALEHLNHLFQKAETGMVAEYGTIEETIDPEVLKLMSDWLLEQINAKPISE